ncbi:protein OSCP1 [Zerene cesonia]|uniref:protein OSCP1 n=1 Tax=Zerene cesonia TaxID=33412 RepID=UPI0018E59861|nr:protein OSCP1 [Zerene cesonia]
MSHFATPFIVINLGCEMVYVVEQRLKMQNIPVDKSEIVLTDIITVLLHPKLLEELFIPQPVAPHAVIKQLLEDISASSIMRLDTYSMNKLWDLMTMIFKWQLSVATNQSIFDISRRHLKCVATLLPAHFPRNIIEDTTKRFDALAMIFTANDYKCLCNTLVLWFSEYHSKISVLLRLGLQRNDGTFALPATVSLKFLKNLGENIYKHDNKKKSIDDYQIHCADDSEIRCLLGPMEATSPQKQAIHENNIELSTKQCSPIVLQKYKYFKNIDLSRKNVPSNDLTFTANIPKTTQEDLLEMLENVSLS